MVSMSKTKAASKAGNSFEPDVVIVGSGAAGGMAAYVLTRAGIKTLILEAGRDYDPVAESAMFKWNHEAPLRASSTPEKHFGYLRRHRQWRLGRSGRALYQRAGIGIPLVAFAHAGRTHQPLGAACSTLWAL